MGTRQHRRHSTEFKLQVVKAYLDAEGSLKAIARRYWTPGHARSSGMRSAASKVLPRQIFRHVRRSCIDLCFFHNDWALRRRIYSSDLNTGGRWPLTQRVARS